MEEYKRKNYPKFEEIVINFDGEVNTSYIPVKTSMYYKHYLRWLKVFPKEQILILDGDKMTTNPAEVVAKVEKYLGLPHALTEDKFHYNERKGFFCMKLNETKEKCQPPSKGRKQHVTVDEKVISKLRKFYAPYNDIFYDITGIQFDWPTS